jgi:Domain of unknown function (DUF3395)
MTRTLLALVVLVAIGCANRTPEVDTSGSAPPPPTTQPAAQPMTADVTAKVASQVKDNNLTITPDPDAVGADPAVGSDKRLRVEYTVNGKPHTVTVEQGHTLNIPSDADGDGPIVVVKATWGVPAQIPTVTADVTAKVKAAVKNDALTLTASNENLDVDPAVGLTKELKVEYTVDGKAHSAKANEGDDLTIPAPADGTGALVIVKATWQPAAVQAQ